MKQSRAAGMMGVSLDCHVGRWPPRNDGDSIVILNEVKDPSACPSAFVMMDLSRGSG
jgi:hypothetical protein